MKISKIILGSLSYLIVTFPLAFVWHLVIFKSTYEQLGYFGRKQPIIAFGFLAILVQGIILSILFPCISRGKSRSAGAAAFIVLMGVYHWTVHVLAKAAKHPIEPLTTWFALETTYLAIQFCLAGLLMSLIYRPVKETIG